MALAAAAVRCMINTPHWDRVANAYFWVLAPFGFRVVLAVQGDSCSLTHL